MFHFHKWELVIKKRTTISRITFGYKETSVPGLRALEVCEKCGKTRAWLIDSNGDAQEKVPELLFSDDELEKANVYGELDG